MNRTGSILMMVAVCILLTATGASSDTLFQVHTANEFPVAGKSFGGTWADIDRDGQLDFLLSHHGNGMGLYFNRPGLQLARQDSCAYLPCQNIDQHGTAACDYDCDGDWDLYTTVGADRGEGTGPNQMWMLGSDGKYVNRLPAKHAMADAQGRGRGAIWARLDDDRYPELIVLNFGTPSRLFHYNGKTWEDKSRRVNPYLMPNSPRANYDKGRGMYFSTAAAADLDRDGHTDLVLAGDGHFMFRNDGEGGLIDVAAAAGLPEKVTILVDIVLGDVDNDGDLDILYVFRYLGGVQIWLNQSTPGNLKFVQGPSLEHLPLAAELNSALLADFDNDGILDLQVMMHDQEFNNRPNVLARGTGGGNFVDVTTKWGAQAAVAALPCGAWPLDLDRDGDLDLLQLHGKEDFPDRTGLVVLHENTTSHKGLTLELATGPHAPHGLGATVELHTTGGRQVKQVRCVVHYWNATISPLHFGLGNDSGPYRAVVSWPSGHIQEISLPRGGTSYLLTEGQEVVDQGLIVNKQ